MCVCVCVCVVNDEFEDAKLIEDVVFYLWEKTYRVDCTKNWKRSVRRKAEKFETRDGEILYRKKDCMSRLLR